MYLPGPVYDASYLYLLHTYLYTSLDDAERSKNKHNIHV